MTVEVASGASVVTCSVVDTGVGVPREERRKIFEPFYRSTAAVAQRHQPSTGLGLALAKRIVEAHGGSIWVVPSSRGSLFAFELPAAAASAS